MKDMLSKCISASWQFVQLLSVESMQYTHHVHTSAREAEVIGEEMEKMVVEQDDLSLRSLVAAIVFSLFFLQWLAAAAEAADGQAEVQGVEVRDPVPLRASEQSEPFADGGGHGQGETQPNAHCHPSSRIPPRHVEKDY